MRLMHDLGSALSCFAVLAVTSHNTHTRSNTTSHHPLRVATSWEVGIAKLAAAIACISATQSAFLLHPFARISFPGLAFHKSSELRIAGLS